MTARRLFLLAAVLAGASLALSIWTLARSSSSATCATWSYTGTVPALRQAAASHPGTCR